MHALAISPIHKTNEQPILMAMRTKALTMIFHPINLNVKWIDGVEALTEGQIQPVSQTGGHPYNG